MNALMPAEAAKNVELILDAALIDADAKLAFLQRASARCTLVELGEIALHIAFDELVEPFSEIFGFPACEICGSMPCINESFCEACRLADQSLAQKRRRR